MLVTNVDTTSVGSDFADDLLTAGELLTPIAEFRVAVGVGAGVRAKGE